MPFRVIGVFLQPSHRTSGARLVKVFGLEFLWPDQGVDQVDGQAEGHGAAENKIENHREVLTRGRSRRDTPARDQTGPMSGPSKLHRTSIAPPAGRKDP